MHVVGAVPGGLPHLGLPKVDWSWSVIRAIDSDGVCDVRGDPGPERGNLQRLCHALRASASARTPTWSVWPWPILEPHFPGTFVVNGSPTKTQIVDSAGGRSQLSLLVMSGDRACSILLFFTAAAGVHAGSGLVGHRVSDRHRPDRYRRDAQDLCPTAIGVLGGTDHRARRSWWWAWNRESCSPSRCRSSSTPGTGIGRRTRCSCRTPRAAALPKPVSHGCASGARPDHLPLYAQLVLRKLPAVRG